MSRPPPRLERRHFLLVHNPTAGVKGGSLVRKVVAALEAQGATVDIAAPREEGWRGHEPARRRRL